MPSRSTGVTHAVGVNVHRLGTAGREWRRRIILAEFIAGVGGMVGMGISVLTQSAEPSLRAAGVWLISAGLNYAPLEYGLAPKMSRAISEFMGSCQAILGETGAGPPPAHPAS